MNATKERPTALVLAYGKTGLGTVRGLAAGRVEVHAGVFTADDPIRWSRDCKVHLLTGLDQDEDRLLEWLVEFGQQHGQRPVLIPTSDAHALLLARELDRLSPLFRLSTSTSAELTSIVSKGLLYRAAETVGVPVVPWLAEPTVSELDRWLDEQPGPWMAKPFFEAFDGCSLGAKNRVFNHRAELLDYARSSGTRGLVIQRMLRGGDGYVFDCYGLTTASGKPVAMASHRRLRQMPPHRGCTSFGEIPAAPDGMTESILFEYTQQLLSALRHHGIFGVEWLQERSSGRLYLIDFNARPFSSIGHLNACGLNLPLLAWRDLVGEPLPDWQHAAPLRHYYWVDLIDDLRSMARRPPAQRRWLKWLKSLLACRRFAYWSVRDPLPALARTWTALTSRKRSRQLAPNSAPSKSAR